MESNPTGRHGGSDTTGMLAFVVITFVSSWGCMFAAPLVFGVSLVNPLAQLSFAMLPALVGSIVRAWITKEGFGDAGLRPRARGAAGYYLGAWLGPFGLVAVTLLLATMLGLWHPDLSALDSILPGLPGWLAVGLLLLVLPLLTPLYWGEEFGWTSYLRLRLMPNRPIVSTLATGLIWAVWHYPLAFLGYIEFDNTAAGLAIWTYAFIGQEVVLSWLRLRSGTIWTTSLAHAGNNMVLFLLTGALLQDQGVSVDVSTALVALAITPFAGWIMVTGNLASPRREPSAQPDSSSHEPPQPPESSKGPVTHRQGG